MAALPAFDLSDLVTKSDLALFGAELRAELRNEFRDEISGLGARVGMLEVAVANLQEGQTGIHLRLDRLFLTLVGGLIVIVGAMAGIVFMP
jgi:regulator of protease activity HflC (stomatin/prohibitin superfamily)